MDKEKASPPWKILLNIISLQRIKPWEIELRLLIKSFLDDLRKSGYIDFSSSGTILLSSAIIHRMKTENILKMDKQETSPIKKINDFVPPPLQLPIKSEYTITTFKELIDALEKVLQEIDQKNIEEKIIVPKGIDIKVEEFILKIEEEIEKFYDYISNILSKKERISFRELIMNVDRKEAVKRFILLLFIASRKYIDLIEENDEIFIIRANKLF
ncbi:MAG: hypothetical protein QXF09_00630 [Nitrososphaerota archaeon]